MTKHSVSVRVNGRLRNTDVDAQQLLVYHLREDLGLTGTHVGCVIGECGACSILFDGSLVKSCLLLAVQSNGHEVTTIEGLRTADGMSLLQQAFVDEYGLQCGYCTPGMILAASALLEANDNPTDADIREALAGNLCMCTGYVQIIRAVQHAVEQLRSKHSAEH